MIYSIIGNIALIGIVAFLFKLNQKNKQKYKNEKAKSKSLEKNIEVLKDNHAAVKDIKEKYTDTIKQIKGAKTNEQVENVISDIISLNNNRVYDNPDER